MLELSEDSQILDAGQIHLPTGTYSQVQYVLVRFRKGKAPALWTDLPDDESNWATLPPETQQRMAEVLKTAVSGGKVQVLCMSFDSWGEDYFFIAEFDKGEAVLLYNACDEFAAAPCNPGRPGGWEEAQVSIGGQTPVPRACTLEDMEKAAQIIHCFLETGTLSSETKWAVNTEGGLPWNF